MADITQHEAWPLFISTPGLSWEDAKAQVAASKNARRAEYDAAYEQAVLAGNPDPAKFARRALAQRHGEPIAPEDLTIPELEALLAKMTEADPGAVLGTSNVLDAAAGESAEPTQEDLDALAASMDPAQHNAGVSMARVAAKQAENEAAMKAAARRAAIVGGLVHSGGLTVAEANDRADVIERLEKMGG
jgi:hypothetical protein